MSISYDSDSPAHRALEAIWERVREAYEHYPQRLTVVVNGTEVASQDVGSARTRQNIKLNNELKPEVIEVFSEQGLCLLTMHVDATPPETPPDIGRQIVLSHGRKLETSPVSASTWRFPIRINPCRTMHKLMAKLRRQSN